MISLYFLFLLFEVLKNLQKFQKLVQPNTPSISSSQFELVNKGATGVILFRSKHTYKRGATPVSWMRDVNVALQAEQTQRPNRFKRRHVIHVGFP